MLRNLPHKIKNFLFSMLPKVVQEFYLWKKSVNIDIDTGFDNFMSTHLNHEYTGIYAIYHSKRNTIISYEGELCMYHNIHKAAEFYIKHSLDADDTYKICQIDITTNITKICY